MPILACQLPAHHLGKHVHRALPDQLHPWVGARHVPQLPSVLQAPPSSFVLTPYHVPCPSLSLSCRKACFPASDHPRCLPSLALCSAISEHLKACSSSVCTAPGEAFTVQVYLPGKRLGSSLAVPPAPSKDKRSVPCLFCHSLTRSHGD